MTSPQLVFIPPGDVGGSNLEGVTLLTPTSTTKYGTIAAALAVAVSGDTVLVGPGNYAEDFMIPDGVTVTGFGARFTLLGANAASGTRVTITGTGSLQRCNLICPSNSDPGLLFTGGAGVISNCTEVVVIGSGVSSIGVRVNGGDIAATLTINNFGFFGAFDIGCDIVAGGFNTGRGGAVTSFCNSMFRSAAGTRNRWNDWTVSFSSVVTTVFDLDGGTNTLQLCNIRAGTNGIAIDGDTVDLRTTGLTMDDAVTNHLIVDAGVTSASAIIDGEMDSRKITGPSAWLSNAENYLFSYRDPSTVDRSLKVWGELQVGMPEQGHESALGQGDSYTRGMMVFTTDNTASGVSDGGNFIDVSAAAASPDSSTFGFQGLTANHTILVGTTLEDGGGSLMHFGHRMSLTVARSGGAVVTEIWDGAAWVTLDVMNSLRNTPHTPLGGTSETFDQLETQIRFGIITNNMLGIPGTAYVPTPWARKTINGIGPIYWVRYRITSLLTTGPTIEQIRLHGSRLEVNPEGFSECFGESRRRFVTMVHQRLADDLSGASPGNTPIELAAGLTITPVDNNFASSTTDGFGMIILLPFDIDVGFPMMLRLGWRPSNTDVGNVRWETEYRIFGEGDQIDAAQALTGTVTESQAAPGTTDQLVFYEVLLDVSTAVPGRSYIGLGIQRLGGDAADTFTGAAEIVFFQGFGISWIYGGG